MKRHNLVTSASQPLSLLRQSLSQCRKAFGYNFFFSFACNVLVLSMPIYTTQIYNRVLASRSLDTLLMLTVFVVVTHIILGILYAARSFVFIEISQWLEEKLAPHYITVSISDAAVKRTLSGSQLLRDLNVVKNFITGPTLISLFDAPWAPLFIAALFFVNVWIGYLTLGAAILLLLLGWVHERLTKGPAEKVNAYQLKGFSDVENAIRNADVIETMGMREAIISNWQSQKKESAGVSASANRLSTLISSFTKTLRLLIQIASMGVGAYLAIDGQMSAGGIFAVSLLSGKALAPFESAVGLWKSLIGVRQSYRRLSHASETFSPRPSLTDLPTPKGNLEFEKVVFAINSAEKPIIRGVHVSVEAGETVLVIGPSGSGKSTLMKLACGLWRPSGGAVRLDHADISALDRCKIGPHIGYLPQDIELMSGTVRDNISRMNKDADDEKVVAAAQFAGVHEAILRLPKGYETPVGVDGSYLSGGQRQRIALARAFFGQPKLVILDEPNSNLDQEGDSALCAAITAAKQAGITLLVVSHRPNLVPLADKLLVIVEGAAAAYGLPEEVMKKLQSGTGFQ